MTAISDFASLQDAILDETQRAGRVADVARVARFVQAAEQMIANGTIQAPAVRVADMEKSVDVAFVGGIGTLPADFLEQVRFYWDGNYNLRLTYRIPQDFWDNRYINGAGALPVIYTVEGSTITLSPAATGTGKLRYYARYAAMNGSADTNWLLQNSQVYFHGACFHAFKHLRNDEKAQEHMAGYIDAVAALHLSNERKRTGGRALHPRIPKAAVRC